MDDIRQVVEEKITRLESELRLAKLQRVKLQEAEQEATQALVIERQPHLTKREKASAVKAIAPTWRVESSAERDAMNAKIKATAQAERPKRGRKAGEKREKTIGERILGALEMHQAATASDLAVIIPTDGHGIINPRSISYTLQNLKKAGKVVRNGSLWSRTIGAIAPTAETVEEEDFDMMPSPIAADSDPDFGVAAFDDLAELRHGVAAE